MAAAIKVIERATNNVFTAQKIDGGYEIFTTEGEHYKKVKDTTFKRYFKVLGEPSPQEEKISNKSETKRVEHTIEERQAMIDKIKKILALAENNPSMEEGLAAALKAQELMAEYNIHEEDVEWEEVRDQITSTFVNKIDRRVLMAWRKQLALIIGRNFRCKVYMKGNAIAFRGYKEDTKIAAEIYKSIYIVGDKLAMKEQAKVQKATGSGKGIYNTFIAGFLKGIEDGLGEQCTALMVVVPKEVEEEYAVFSKDFDPKRTKALEVLDKGVYDKGVAEGKAAVKSRAIEGKE